MGISIGALVISVDFSMSALIFHLLEPETWTWSLTTVYSWSYGVPVFLIGLLLVVAELVKPVLAKAVKSKTLL